MIRRGTGKIKVNGECDFPVYWTQFQRKLEILTPMVVTESCGLFDIYIAARSGGQSGQASAVRLALARALAIARPACVVDFEDRQLLKEDTKQPFPKESGRTGAFTRRSWAKR